MVGFTTTGAIDTMDSDAAVSLNNTASTFTSLPIVLVVIVVMVIVLMLGLSRSAF
jgi:hypothetical protein